MRIAIVIPTTSAPLLVERISPRARLPRSLVLTRGDYRPVPGMSERYHHFVDAAGPLSDILAAEDVRYELCLTQAPETGRSWELPVALAHYVREHGHDIVTHDANIVIWATGAVGSDGDILDDDYHLQTKRDGSRVVIDQLRGAETLVLTLIPHAAHANGEEHDNERCVAVANLRAAITALDTVILEKNPKEPCAEDRTSVDVSTDESGSSKTRRKGGIVSGVGLLAMFLIAGGGSYWFWSAEQSLGGDASIPGDIAVNGSPDTTDEIVETNAASADMARSPPLLSIIAHRAPEGSSCIDALFGGVESKAQELQAQDDVFPAIETPGLCALGFHGRGEFSGKTLSLDENILAVILPSERRDAFTLDPDEPTRMNLVAQIPAQVSYLITLRSEDGWETVFRHRLNPPDADVTAAE